MKELREGGVAVRIRLARMAVALSGEASFSQPPQPITDEMRFHIVGYPSEKLTYFCGSVRKIRVRLPYDKEPRRASGVDAFDAKGFGENRVDGDDIL